MRSVTIRPAAPADAGAVARIAALDSAPLPAGELLLGLVDDEPWAVLSLSSGVAVADPFRPSAQVVALLRERARPLRYPASNSARRSLWRRRTVIAGPSSSASSSH